MDVKSYRGRRLGKVSLEMKTLQYHEFEDCVFEGCTFLNVTFKECLFLDCKFVRCTFADIKNQGTDFKGCEFEGCNLLSLNWADVFTSRSAMMPSVKSIKNCSIKYGIFSKINFGKFNFSTNDIVDSTFSDCRLSCASFKGCNLKFTEFLRTDITGADFTGASGYQVEITTCRMKGARFSFPEAMNLLNGLGVEIE